MTRLQLVSIGVMVGYSIARVVAVWALLQDYGVDPLLFAVIDVGTAIPYGYAWPRLAECISRNRARNAAGWLCVAAAAFVAPYAYLMTAGSQYPVRVLVGLLAFVLLAAGWAVYGVVSGAVRARSQVDGSGDAAASVSGSA